jgi:uncharacterized protein YjiS (DUF1127 family)
MAQKTLTLTHREPASLVRSLEISLTGALRAMAEDALTLLSEYEDALASVQRGRDGRNGPVHLTLGQAYHVLAERRRTISELSRKSDRDLADLNIPRPAIRAAATVAAFTAAAAPGQPTAPLRASGTTSFASRVARTLEAYRREAFPSDEERAEAYLAGAGDIYDLEARMRELDRKRRRTAFGWPA